MVIPRKAICPSVLPQKGLNVEQPAGLRGSEPAQSKSRAGVDGLSPSAPNRPAGAASAVSAPGLAPRKAAPLDVEAQFEQSLAQVASQVWQAVGAQVAEAGLNVAAKRRALQHSQAQLQAAAPEQKAAQELVAHQNLLDLTQQEHDLPATATAVLHKVLLVGVVGAGMTFGVTRSAGMAMAAASQQKAKGLPIAWGLFAPNAQAAAQAGSALNKITQAAATVGVQWLAGALAGGVGNIASQRVFAPLVNLMPQQYAPILASVVVPTEMRAEMNRKDEMRRKKDKTPASGPLAGDQLYQQVLDLQADVSRIDSDRNIALGQICFSITTAMRALAQGPKNTGVAGTIALGVAVSAGAGTMLAVAQCVNASQAHVSVPDMAALRQAKSLADVPVHEVPVIYMKSPEARTQAPVKVVASTQLETQLDIAAPQQDMRTRAAHFAASAAKLSASAGHRAARLAQATTPGTMLGVVTAGVAPMAVKAMTTHLAIAPAVAVTSIRTTVATVGVWCAVKPWFEAQARHIPQFDANL
jgi:hypothetical protein